jgi:hypothetical protein
LEQGFQSLPKRDLDLLIFILLEIDGAIDRRDDNYDVGRTLRVTPQKVRLLRRDAYARWRPLVGEARRDALRRILTRVLTRSNIDAGAKHAAEKTKEQGFVAVLVEHSDDQAEFEQAIKDAGAIPVYERNREVIAVRFDTLLRISEMHEFIPQDPKKIKAELRRVASGVDDLEEFLKTPVKDLTWEDARSAINTAGAKAVAGLADVKLTSLLKVLFPFLR